MTPPFLKPFLLVLACVAVVEALSWAQEREPPSAVGDLAVVVRVLKDPKATAAQRQALIGRTFSGVVAVERTGESSGLARRIYSGQAMLPGQPVEPPAVLIFVNLGRQTMVFSVPVRIDQASLDRDTYPLMRRLRNAQRVRVRGTLSDFLVGARPRPGEPTLWARFVDAVVERWEVERSEKNGPR